MVKRETSEVISPHLRSSIYNAVNRLLGLCRWWEICSASPQFDYNKSLSIFEWNGL